MTQSMNRRRFAGGLAAAGALAALPGAGRAQQSWPPGRVTLVVPFPAGAATDVTGRVVAEKLAQMWGVPVVVENKGGGNGLPAAEAVARAKPDGLTLLLTSAMTHAVNPALYDKLPYHPLNDFEPITPFIRLPFVVLVPADSPIKTLADLTALIRAQPGKHNFGAGSLPARVASEFYRQLVGANVVYIGYKSNPQAFPDLRSGRLTFMIIDTLNGRIQIDSGALRGLAITTQTRDPKLPQVPTTVEVGLPDFQLWTWTGFYAPKGTPREVVSRIQRDIVTAGNDPQVAARLDNLGGLPVTSTPDEFAAFTRSEIERWGKIIRAANIKPE